MLYTENNSYCDNPGYYGRSRSSGVAKTGAALGGVGTGLGAINLLGNLGSMISQCRNNANDTPTCSENFSINRYEASLIHENMVLRAEAEHGKITGETDKKLLDLYAFINGELNAIKAQACDQRVINQHTSDMTDSMMTAMRNQKEEMMRLIDNEACERNKGDARAVDYANCTFVPQTICGVECDPKTAYLKQTSNPFCCGRTCGR